MQPYFVMEMKVLPIDSVVSWTIKFIKMPFNVLFILKYSNWEKSPNIVNQILKNSELFILNNNNVTLFLIFKCEAQCDIIRIRILLDQKAINIIENVQKENPKTHSNVSSNIWYLSFIFNGIVIFFLI